MALKKTDPWYMHPPAGGLATPEHEEERRRYARALRLSLFAIGRGSRDAAYRQMCLDNWRDYLDGRIDPPTGSKPRS